MGVWSRSGGCYPEKKNFRYWPVREIPTFKLLAENRPFGSARRDQFKRNRQRQVVADSCLMTAYTYTQLVDSGQTKPFAIVDGLVTPFVRKLPFFLPYPGNIIEFHEARRCDSLAVDEMQTVPLDLHYHLRCQKLACFSVKRIRRSYERASEGLLSSAAECP
jgi:hypothetical protein